MQSLIELFELSVGDFSLLCFLKWLDSNATIPSRLRASLLHGWGGKITDDDAPSRPSLCNPTGSSLV